MPEFDAGNSEAIWDKREEERRDSIEEQRISEQLEEEIYRIIAEETIREDEIRRKAFDDAQKEAFPYLDEIQKEEELNDEDYAKTKGL